MQEVEDFLEGGVLNEIVDCVTEIAEFPFKSFDFAQLRFVGDDSFESFGNY